MHIHTRSVKHKVFEVWRSPGNFTKNPDVVQLKTGRLLLIYSDCDQHWSQVRQILTILASDDLGRTWFKLSEVHTAHIASGDERLVTPRLSYLSDGRLAALCDHNDFGHFHEDQPPGNWIWWSADDGITWDGPHANDILGFEPDRIIELPDGKLAVGSQVMRRESQEFAEVLSVSEDKGITWREFSTMAHNGYHRVCEGAVLVMDKGKTLACVMRENHSGGIPCLVVFSEDHGKTWSDPQICPFALHRPYAKQLADGRVLVTGRHVNGGLGTYGWVGDLRAEAGTYAVGGPRRKFSATLENGALVIENKAEHECRYGLLPPQDSFSEVLFEAEVKVDGPADAPLGFLSCGSLGSRTTKTVLIFGRNFIRLGEGARTDVRSEVDLTYYRRLTLHHLQGLLQVRLDDKVLIQECIYHSDFVPVDFHGGRPEVRTQFGQYGNTGRSIWRDVKYETKNRTLDDFAWTWQGASGQYPDQYQRDRLIQIHSNHPDQKPWPDHGYSSWLPLEDGRIFLVDYTNLGDAPGTSHLVGLYLEPEDLR